MQASPRLRRSPPLSVGILLLSHRERSINCSPGQGAFHTRPDNMISAGVDWLDLDEGASWAVIDAAPAKTEKRNAQDGKTISEIDFWSIEELGQSLSWQAERWHEWFSTVESAAPTCQAPYCTARFAYFAPGKKSEVKISAPGLFALLIWEIFMGARYAPLDIAHLIRFSLNRVYFIGRNEGFQASIETGKPQAVGPN